LAALRHRNFALFWTGALLSSTGTWVQNVTVPYVVFQLTSSVTWVGFAAFAQLLPMSLASLVGGWLADRVPRRTMLLATQTASATVAMALWVVWATGRASVLSVVGLVAVAGMVGGLTIPAWQAFVSQLVPRELLLNAVTLNSAQFNAARAFGPALGGLVLARLGVGWAFLLNAVSFAAVVVALLFITVAPLVRSGVAEGVWRSLVSSARYVAGHRGISTCVLAVAALGLLASPVNSLLVVFADQVFGVGRLAYGFMGAALGVGAVAAAPLVAGRGTRVSRRRLAGGAMVVHGGGLVAFALAPVYWVALLCLMVAGAAYLAVAATLNTSLQLQVEEHRRAKVLALYVTVLTIALPIGALVQGAVASVVGVRATVAVAAALFVAVTVVLARSGRLASLDGMPSDAHQPLDHPSPSDSSSGSA